MTKYQLVTVGHDAKPNVEERLLAYLHESAAEGFELRTAFSFKDRVVVITARHDNNDNDDT